MDYVLSFIVVFFIYPFMDSVRLIGQKSGYIISINPGNLDHMLNGTMKSLTNPACFMKLLNRSGRSFFKKKSVKHYLRQSKWLYNPICSMYGMFTNI